MLRAQRPSTPGDDLDAFKSWAQRAPAARLSPELERFVQSGVSVIVATSDRHGCPLSGLALGARVPEPGAVRVLLSEARNADLVKALVDGGRLAATWSQPMNHRSIQAKGDVSHVERATAEDHRALFPQLAAFRAELMDVGYSDDFATFYCAYDPHELVALTFIPDAVFVQTPGVGAGSALSP